MSDKEKCELSIHPDPPKVYPFKALLLLFKGFNTLDVNAPLEVFRKSGQSNYFSVTVAAEEEITTSVEGAQMKRDIPLDFELLRSGKIRNYDILIVPGGGSACMDKQLAKTDGPFMQTIAVYASNTPPTGSQRILLSICVGSLFLGTMGVLNDPKIPYATTHWLAYSKLADINVAVSKSLGGTPGTVIPARFVDSGLNSSGVHIITSGGISCGIDGSLHTVKTIIGGDKGDAEAKDTARLLDYAWRQTEGVTFGTKYTTK